MKTLRVILVGGTTAGHILPLLEVKNELEKIRKCKFLYVGAGTSLEGKLVRSSRIKHRKIICGKFRRDRRLLPILMNLLDLLKVIVGIIQSVYIVSGFKADLVFSKSGFVAIPVALACRILGKTFIIHESDTTAGLATRLVARFSHALLTAFPAALFPAELRKKAIYSGLPLKKQFETINSVKEDYILITGGSSGAEELNHRLGEVIPRLIDHHRIVHITGIGKSDELQKIKEGLEKSKQDKYEIIEYSDDMPGLIARAKLVISRAGASTIFEIAAMKKKCILMPITSGVASHQIDNARLLGSLGLADELNPNDSSSDIIRKIEKTLKTDQSVTAAKLFFPQSALYIANLLNDFANFYAIKRMKAVFLIGIGGVSMKAIGHILGKLGIRVRGSDIKTGGHSKENINLGYDLVIYSSAADNNSSARSEHQRAKELKIPIIKRSKFIGWLMGGYRGISVSGMHGKTSVSALIAKVLEDSGSDPSYLIGAPATENFIPYRLGRGIDFVSEACEYDGSFLDFNTKIAVINNIEEEHLDYFSGGLSEIIEVFTKFVFTIKPGGALVYNRDDENVLKVVKASAKYIEEHKINLISFGFDKNSDVKISDYEAHESKVTFKLNGMLVESNIFGKFYAYNSAACYGVAKFIGISDEQTSVSIASFGGAARRMEYIGERGSVKIYDDYGHHPTEISQTLEAFKERFPSSRRFVIFEPHQQKRFNDFFKDFVEVFEKADAIVGILPVHRVPGRDVKAIHTVDELIQKLNSPRIIPLDNYEMASNFLAENLKRGDILLTMGATDVYKIGRHYLNN